MGSLGRDGVRWFFGFSLVHSGVPLWHRVQSGSRGFTRSILRFVVLIRVGVDFLGSV